MPKNPGAARDVRVLGEPTSNTCDVHVADEGITLRFMRGNNAKVVCIGRDWESSDTPRRASNRGYAQAIGLASEMMHALDTALVEREKNAPANIKILESSTIACKLEYLGWQQLYRVEERTPLEWDTLEQYGAMAPKDAINLTAAETRALKQRAFSVIQNQRKRESYSKDGLGQPQNLGQLIFPIFAKAS